MRIPPKEKRLKVGPWFAWYPVQTHDGYSVWLETVFREQRYEYGYFWTKYSLYEPSKPE